MGLINSILKANKEAATHELYNLAKVAEKQDTKAIAAEIAENTATQEQRATAQVAQQKSQEMRYGIPLHRYERLKPYIHRDIGISPRDLINDQEKGFVNKWFDPARKVQKIKDNNQAARLAQIVLEKIRPSLGRKLNIPEDDPIWGKIHILPQGVTKTPRGGENAVAYYDPMHEHVKFFAGAMKDEAMDNPETFAYKTASTIAHEVRHHWQFKNVDRRYDGPKLPWAERWEEKDAMQFEHEFVQENPALVSIMKKYSNWRSEGEAKVINKNFEDLLTARTNYRKEEGFIGKDKKMEELKRQMDLFNRVNVTKL